jgi:hypothetical protein
VGWGGGGGGHVLDKQPVHVGIIDFEGKNVLVRPSQAGTTKGKNVVIGESRNKTSKDVETTKPSLHHPWGRYGSSVPPQMCYGASHSA